MFYLRVDFCSKSNFQTNIVYMTYIYVQLLHWYRYYVLYILYSSTKITTEDRTFQNWFCLFIRCVSCHCFVYIFKYVAYWRIFVTLFKAKTYGNIKKYIWEENIGRIESYMFPNTISDNCFPNLCVTELDLLIPRSGLGSFSNLSCCQEDSGSKKLFWRSSTTWEIYSSKIVPTFKTFFLIFK